MINYKNKRGFTLVEMIVSVGLFTVVMVIASGAYLSVVNLERKSRALSDVMTNLNFVSDSMARAIRSGSNYSCNGGGDCSGGATFSFTDEAGQTVTYLLKGATGPIGQCSSGACNANNAITITDPRITIDRFSFTLRGSSSLDTVQPIVTYILSGSIIPDPRSLAVPFTIQAAATQRLLDLP